MARRTVEEATLEEVMVAVVNELSSFEFLPLQRGKRYFRPRLIAVVRQHTFANRAPEVSSSPQPAG